MSALLDWGRFCLQRGDAAEAKQAFEEIGQRWPRHPWAGLGMADWAAACGWEAEARRWRAKATRMARTSLPREHPDELS